MWKLDFIISNDNNYFSKSGFFLLASNGSGYPTSLNTLDVNN